LEDITQRKKAEMALSISENKYRTLFDNAGDGILLMKDNLFVECNEKALEIYGATRDQIIGQSPYKFSPEFQPDGERSEDKAIEFINKALDGHSQNFEWKHLRYDGTPFYAGITLNQLQIGNEYLLQAIVRDITERKEVEYLLKKSAERFRAVAESAVDAIVTTDAKGNIMFFNNSLTTIFGYTKEEIIGKSLTILMPERFRIDYLKELEKFEKSGEHRLIGRIVATTGLKKDGSEFPFEMSLAAWKSRGKKYFTSIIRDITERKLAEEALHESEEKYKTLFESGPSYTILLGFDGIILDFNVSAEQIIGISKEELVGKHFSELKIFPEEDLSLHEKKFLQIFKHEVVDPYESKIIDKNGEIRWGDTSLTIIRKNNVPAYVLVIFNDITERKQSEEALRKYKEHLEELVEERTADLRVANEEIRKFTYIASHDMRAPLINIKGFTGELRLAIETVRPAINKMIPLIDEESREKIRTAFQQDIPEALGFISTSVSRMDSLISSILILSRLGRRILTFEPVDMNGLVQDILKTLAFRIDEMHVTVEAEPLPEVIADRICMEQIMGNLLDNAIKYLSPERRGLIRIRGEQEEELTAFHIQDNGRGIAGQDIPKIFDIFTRAGSQDIPGEGMGLAYVQTMVRRHGGHIWCTSEPGVETTFTFTILKKPVNGGPYDP
jgi:PAS domain S-box-containing protein